MNIVLTRPYKDSVKLKEKIESHGAHKCYIQPLIEIEILEKQIDIPEKAIVVITSVNGIKALAKNTQNRSYRIITVGDHSAHEAKKLGFLNIESAVTSPDISASEANLIKYIRSHIENITPIFHISANITKGGLKKRLQQEGYKYNRIVLYNSVPVEFTDDFIKKTREGDFDGFAFFSPRTAAIFSKQLFEKGLSPFIYRSVAFCFSENVILGLSGLNFGKIYIPEVTNSENFVKLVHDYEN